MFDDPAMSAKACGYVTVWAKVEGEPKLSARMRRIASCS
jgi:hypothetical protein